MSDMVRNHALDHEVGSDLQQCILNFEKKEVILEGKVGLGKCPESGISETSGVLVNALEVTSSEGVELDLEVKS